MKLSEARHIIQEVAAQAVCIAKLMLDNMPPGTDLSSLTPTELLKFSLDEVEAIMRDRNKRSSQRKRIK